ncbi:MAG: TIGR00296 family protein [Candidatus Micrarchaeota archaeon]|nr:TIGR00296 family protein [Candidatus Micrarchaeota archaeon]
MRQYSETEGEQIVRGARAAIELFLRSPNLDRNMLVESLKGLGSPNGVFVTVLHYPTRELRGRMGIHGARKHIGELVVDAAIAAGFEDPKFVPVSLNESSHMTVEVDILSDFELIKSSGKGKLIKVKMGRDGIYIKYGFKSAVLLPSFPEENNLDKTGFFEAACKAVGIQKDLWMQPNIKLYRFRAQGFAETEPDGRVIEIKRE